MNICVFSRDPILGREHISVLLFLDTFQRHHHATHPKRAPVATRGNFPECLRLRKSVVDSREWTVESLCELEVAECVTEKQCVRRREKFVQW
jgi:hypothetical protein